MHHAAPLIRITDVSPRDGLQNESVRVSPADKAALAAMLMDAGVDEVELTSFVSPQWVPQLGDASEVCVLVAMDAVQRASTHGASSQSTLARPAPFLSALAPNLAGLQSLLAVNASAKQAHPHASFHPLIDKVSVFTAASESFAKKNTNASIAQTFERFAPMVAEAHKQGLRVRGYISCVIACPFEGPIAPQRVRRVADALLALGVDEIDLGDTIGAATAANTRALLHDFADIISRAPTRIASRDEPAFTLHLHDTFGHAGECIREALALGVRSFDGSVAGLGGCPYASTPDRPAPGNIATELVASIAREFGFACNIDDAKLAQAAVFARSLVKR